MRCRFTMFILNFNSCIDGLHEYLIGFSLYFICLSYACMYYIKVWIYDVILMACGLFLIFYLVLCVLASDLGTSTVNTETRILPGSVISYALIPFAAIRTK